MLHNSSLGKNADYKKDYSPEILFAIPRRLGRDAVGVPEELPFRGTDLWTGYEVSWLNLKGKPLVAVAELGVPANTEFLVESKSLKLYLNSLNGTRFVDAQAVEACLRADLSKAAGGPVAVALRRPCDFGVTTRELSGDSIDDLDVDIASYEVNPGLLAAGEAHVHETLRSGLLKSNCPVTGQPDWADVAVRYVGPQIDRAGLLKYIVSFRDHTGFHEQCVEQIFMDIKARCKPERLTVYARYTRRGGLDINPFRSDFEECPPNTRTFRQ